MFPSHDPREREREMECPEMRDVLGLIVMKLPFRDKCSFAGSCRLLRGIVLAMDPQYQEKLDIVTRNIYYGFIDACQGGFRDLVEYFIENGAWDWNLGMSSAAIGGHRDLVDFFIDKGANDWVRGMLYAIRGGHRDLVDFFIEEKGACDWNWGMMNAAQGVIKVL